MPNFIRKNLFGGAITIELPENAFDVSKIRQVPDHEEVFVHPKSDQSLMIEILEHVDLDDSLACEHYFKDLAEANQCSNNYEIIESFKINDFNLDNCSGVWYLSGNQNISKYNEAAVNKVNVTVVVYRLKSFGSDLLVTFNDPLVIHESSSSVSGINQEKWSREDLHKIIRTIQIKDYSLFNG